MNNGEFWKKVAAEWRTSSDGTGDLPSIKPPELGEDAIAFDTMSNDEIDDILSDLGFYDE